MRGLEGAAVGKRAYPVWTNPREGRVAARLPSPVLLWPPERQDGRNNHCGKCGFKHELSKQSNVRRGHDLGARVQEKT